VGSAIAAEKLFEKDDEGGPRPVRREFVEANTGQAAVRARVGEPMLDMP
jgi:hypothetical protein